MAAGLIVSHRGIPVTSPIETILDLAAILDAKSLRAVVRRAIGVRSIRSEQLVTAVNACPGRPGIAKLRRLVADGVPTRSELEDVVLKLILDGGFRAPDVNVPLTLGGRRVVPDFRWPAEQVIVEADGAAWHDDPIARGEDRARQRLLEAHGETVIRVTWRQAVGEPGRTRRRIASAGAPFDDRPAA